MIVHPGARTDRTRRRGILTVEALLIICLLLLVTIAIIEFGTAITVQHAVNQAASEGAREAALGGSIADVEAVIESTLAPFGLTVESTDSDVVFMVEDPQLTPPNDVRTRGVFPVGSGLSCSTPPVPATVSSGFVRVTVCVSCTSQPFLGQLENLGLSFMGRLMSRSAVIKKECP